MESLNIISKEIQSLEARRDYNHDLTPGETQYLAVLNFCYELLARTELAQAAIVPTPEEMKDSLGDDQDFTNTYGITSSAIADTVFSIIAKTGKPSLRAMLSELVRGSETSKPNLSQSAIAEAAGTYPANLSRYLNNQSDMNCETFENIISAIISV